MKGIHVFIIKYCLQFLYVSRRTGYTIWISQKQMTWVESFNYCKLSTEKDVKLFNARYTAWGSGVYLNTRWMIHKGCYKSSDAVDSKTVKAIAQNSPSLCSSECEMSLHFALKYNWCLCLTSLNNMVKETSDKCKYTCAGSKDDSCGDRINYSVYSHVTGKSKPLQDGDPKHTCSVVIRKKVGFILKAVDCSRLYWTACEMQSGAIKIMGHGLSYRSAINRCSLHGNSLPTINEDGVNNLEEGKMYWTNIHRRTFLKWIKDEPVKQICYKVQASLGCLLVLREANGDVQYIQESCQSKFPVICDQVGVEGSVDTMHCKTKNISTLYTTNRPKLVTTSVTGGLQYMTRAYKSTETILDTTRFHKAFQTPGIFVKETSKVSKNLNFFTTLSKAVTSTTSRTAKATLVSRKTSKLQPDYSQTTTSENPYMLNVQSTIVYRYKTTTVTTKAQTTLSTTTSTDLELLQTTTSSHTSTNLPGTSSTTSTKVSLQPVPSAVELFSGVNTTMKTSKHDNDIFRTEDLFVIFYIQIGIVALVTFVAFVLVCLLTYMIALLRRGRETKQSSLYELSSRTTPDPRMYSQLLMPISRIYSSAHNDTVDNSVF
ncbi:uncharacterized protein LOC127709101 [Mytilus californianus]|uniref:uncharacterized protein LOC127709101 n=1 Tax=Mytilus californianus TaxID=6549 RepID=UPI0022464A49|nr:uncharacterized protein LOC127709101 [Mytilus californianus]